jgi:hypothetical protein
MSSNSVSALQFQKRLRNGVAIGIAGGLAEIVVVALYCAVAGASAPDVGRHIASAAGLEGASAWAGVAIHMVLAASLGAAIMFAWNPAKGNAARALPLYATMLSMLAGVWAINFFMVLPVLSPEFVTLLPLPVTLASKLMFGWAAAVALRALQKRKTAPGLSGASPQVAALAS